MIDATEPTHRLNVKLVMRRPLPGQFSVERVFRDVVHALPHDINASLAVVPYASQGVIPRLRNMLFTARLQADVVHITGDIQYCALAVTGRRCLLTVLDLVNMAQLTGWRRHLFFLVWYRLPVLRAKVITTISAEVRAELVAELPSTARKATVIGCPVSSSFRSAQGACAAPQERRQLLQVGTTPNKNLQRVAAAVTGLPVHIQVIGQMTDQQRGAFEQLKLSYSEAANLSDEDMIEAYQRSSVLIFASTYEGFGLPILEAQAIGIPVVTSDRPPMSDIAGGAAVLVDPMDPLSIRRGVEAALDDKLLRAALIDAGKANVQRYSPDRIAAEYADAYRRVGAGKPRQEKRRRLGSIQRVLR